MRDPPLAEPGKCGGAAYIKPPFEMGVGNLRQPQNYIEAVDPDSVEMKTAELLEP